ncbi:MAG: leishmanolysin-related zinc metalloendopeptidase [Myxococcota bacterium]
MTLPLSRMATALTALALAACTGQVNVAPLDSVQGDGGSGDGSGTGSGGSDDFPALPGSVDPPDGFSLASDTPQDQSNFPGALVVAPRIRVRGPGGAPLSDIQVNFIVSEGSLVDTPSLLTDQNGFAELDSWRLSPSVGANELRAVVKDSELVFRADGLSGFTIDLAFDEEVTEAQREAFERARDRWSGVVVGGLPDVAVPRSLLENACGLTSAEETIGVDDVAIFASSVAIDGPGGVLGQAGPCIGRTNDGAPIIGVMEFDRDDLERLEEVGQLETVIVHEMGHVLGIGTLWANLDLLENPSIPDSPGADTHFSGPSTRAAFRRIGGEDFSGSTVPVENQAVVGSSDGHWRESVFGQELMSPSVSIDDVTNPLSEVTVASLEDLGFYTVNFDGQDPFTLPDSTPGNALSITRPSIPLNCKLIRPRAFVD